MSTKSMCFRYHSCSFRIPAYKQNTARAFFWQNFKIPYVFTI
jgi:hypothetical protein